MKAAKKVDITQVGFYCIKQVLEQDLVLLRLNDEIPKFRDRVEENANLFYRDEQVQAEKA